MPASTVTEMVRDAPARLKRLPDLGPGRSEPDQLGETTGAQRAQGAEEVQRLEEVGLALPVAPHHHRGPGRRLDRHRLEIPEVDRLERLEEHYTRIGMTTAV